MEILWKAASATNYSKSLETRAHTVLLCLICFSIGNSWIWAKSYWVLVELVLVLLLKPVAQPWGWFQFCPLSDLLRFCACFGIFLFWDCLCCGLLSLFVKCKVFGSHQADKCSKNAVVLPPGIAELRVWLFCSHTRGADKSCRIWVGSMQMLLSPRMSMDPAGFRFWLMSRRDFQGSQSIVWISALGRLHESKW